MKMPIFSMKLQVVALLILAFSIGCTTTQSPNRQMNDLKITTEIKAKLVSDVEPSSLANIEVNTTNGIVTLAGQVENQDVKRRAEEVALATPGVVRINNNLQIEQSDNAGIR